MKMWAFSLCKRCIKSFWLGRNALQFKQGQNLKTFKELFCHSNSLRNFRNVVFWQCDRTSQQLDFLYWKSKSGSKTNNATVGKEGHRIKPGFIHWSEAKGLSSACKSMPVKAEPPTYNSALRCPLNNTTDQLSKQFWGCYQ